MAALALLSGCGPDEAELRRGALDDAVDRTVEGTLAFNLGVDAEEAALDAFGDATEPLAALLAGSSAAGVVEADRIAVGLALAGADLAQVRVTGPGQQYVRFNLGAVAELATGSSAGITGELEDALAAAGLDPAARDATLAAARGEWVRLEPADDTERSAATSVREALAALLASAEPTGHDGALDAPRFDGSLDVLVDVERALAVGARALAGIAPEATPTAVPGDTDALPGRVRVEDGIVRAVVVELGGLAGDGAGGGGDSIELVLDLRQLDVEEALVTAPEVAAAVTLEELEQAAAALQQLQAGTGP